MKRLFVNLDDDVHEALRRLAFEKNTQMAKLVRYAIDKTFEDDLDGILGEMRLEEHLADPSGSMTIQELMTEYGIEPRRQRSSRRKARGGRLRSVRGAESRQFGRAV